MKRYGMKILLFLVIIVGCLIGVKPVSAESSWKKITKSSLAHTWYNSQKNDNDGLWAEQYRTVFKKNGKVIQTGYRNRDIGTYRISKDKRKVIATFTKCYIDTPGEGYKRIKNYKYKVTYRLKSKKKLYAKYSRKATMTNASTGYLYR